ncbi:MAG TPA: hypothetical protein VH396_03210 [Chitinophagaceae bacterium]|jgi:hypothetical protein
MQKINKIISIKLCRLLLFLHEAGEEFEKVAQKSKDKNIKMSIRSIVVETKQYTRELNSQLQSLRIKEIKSIDILHVANTGKVLNDNYLNNKCTSDKEIIELCCKSEVNFEKAYRNILNEYFPFNALRKLLVYQLNGIKCAFMQLKLLRSAKWV